MNLTINGKNEEFGSSGSQPESLSCRLGDLLRHLEINEEEKGFAVAINEEVVFRNAWKNAKLSDGDRIEIIRATQGG